MSIDRNTANANTVANLATIQTAEDTAFIANVDSQIAQAIALGQYQITATTSPNVNLQTVFSYYSGLGYAVSFPDFAQQNGNTIQNVNFFGYNWVAFWMNAISLFKITNPARMTIAWY